MRPGVSRVQSRSGWVPGLKLKAFLWKFKTAASKRWIALQDRLGWYSYPRWIQENEPAVFQPTPIDPALRFSFLVPVTSESLPRLVSTLNSLQAQTTPNWEACLVYEPACAPGLEAVLGKLPGESDRLLRVALEPGQEPADRLAVASARVKGGWIGLLECGDLLAPGALAACVDCLHGHPRADIVYPDEDCLGPDGITRHSPFFKPDFSPDLLLSVNYLRTALFRRELFSRCAALGRSFEEIIYRCVEGAVNAVHIPRILYHVSPTSGHAESGSSSRQSNRAELVEAHLRRLGLSDAALHFLSSGRAQATWSFEEKLVSIIIPTRDHVALLRRCLESLTGLTSYRRFEIILVENHSRSAETRAYYAQLGSMPQVRLFEYQPAFNYSAANNFGARQARGDWLLFLNNDVEIIDPGWLDELCRWLSRPEVGAVGARLLYPGGRTQHAGIVIGMEGHASHVFAGVEAGYTGPFGSVEWYRDYSAVTGACLAVRREVFASAGGFDESYELAFSDVAFCQRICQQGYRVVYTPFAYLVHHEGQSRSRRIPARDIRRGAEQLIQIVKQGDPYYNPSLSYSQRVPTLKRPFEEEPARRLENIVRYY